MADVLVTVFRYVDEGITLTNRKRAKAKIWSEIDDDDIQTLVDVIMGGAKESKILATTVRKMTASHKLLRVGLITGPRFFQTYQHYAQNGGFMFPQFGRGRQMEQEG